MKNFDKDFEKAMELFVEVNQDKLGLVGRCPDCNGLVMYNFARQCYVCIDCGMFEIDTLEPIENWRIDGKQNQ